MGKHWVFVSLVTLACGDATAFPATGGGPRPEDAGTDGPVATGASGGAAGRSRDASTGSDARSACKSGDEGCQCYGNQTCNGGLTCASNLCVSLSGLDAASPGGGGSSSGGGPPVGGAAGASGRGAGGKRATGGTSGAGGRGATGGTSGAAGRDATGGTGGTHQCFPDQSICNSDPAGCCLGLRCVSATGAPNAVCTPECAQDGECSSGCCVPLKSGVAKVCAPAQYCSGACVPAGGSCTSAASSCCAGTECVYDDVTESTATCAALCDFNTDCLSGCCAPLSDGSGSVCSDTSYCVGSCLPAGTRPCGLGTPCCPGSYCTSDSQNQICLPLCATNADCVSGCCAVPNGNGVHVCTDPAFCPQ